MLNCAVCIMYRTEPDEADTVVDGTAVCIDHIAMLDSSALSRAVTMAKQVDAAGG